MILASSPIVNCFIGCLSTMLTSGVLDVQPTDRVLEVGFGPGLAIAELARLANQGHVYGIDHSDAMVRRTRKRNAAAIRTRRVTLLHTSVDRLPHFDKQLDAIVAVNSLGFWPNPTQQLSELRGLLRPGGRIALASQPRCAGATADTRPTIDQAVAIQDQGLFRLRAVSPMSVVLLAGEPPRWR
ncbi:class I SAM-dependent methyltransferase [Streptomyces sp. NPDC005970]|uniref:class I SAM-dependent methyltransferase n=1 Tax=Streptomyces sp. NPDC005970 TaxID=3156723 RepID=UPI0033FD3B4B